MATTEQVSWGASCCCGGSGSGCRNVARIDSECVFFGHVQITLLSDVMNLWEYRTTPIVVDGWGDNASYGGVYARFYDENDVLLATFRQLWTTSETSPYFVCKGRGSRGLIFNTPISANQVNAYLVDKTTNGVELCDGSKMFQLYGAELVKNTPEVTDIDTIRQNQSYDFFYSADQTTLQDKWRGLF